MEPAMNIVYRRELLMPFALAHTQYELREAI